MHPTLGILKLLGFSLLLFYLSSCGVSSYDEPSIKIEGVASNESYDVRTAAKIQIRVSDPNLKKVYVDVLSGGRILVDSLVKVSSTDFELSLPWELFGVVREPNAYEVVVTAFNENTFGRKRVHFSAFTGYEKEVWHLMWTENAIHTLNEDFSTFSTQSTSIAIDTLIVTPEYASYLVLFEDNNYQLRDIKTHGVILDVKHDPQFTEPSKIAANGDHYVVSLIADERSMFAGDNILTYRDYNGQLLNEMPGRLFGDNYQMNPGKGYTVHSTGPGVVYFQYPAPVDLIKVYHHNKAEYLTFNGHNRDFALVHDNSNYQVLELYQSNGTTIARAGFGSHIQDVVDFAASNSNLFVLEKERLRALNLENLELTDVSVVGSSALYCDYYGDIPYLITENQVYRIDDENLEIKSVKTASETIRGFETLRIR